MKLSHSRIERTLSQVRAQAIPEDHPAIGELNRLFGDHTFLVDGSGLLIVEPDPVSVAGTDAGKVVRLASWQDAERSKLAAHEPEPTDIVVELGPEASNARH